MPASLPSWLIKTPANGTAVRETLNILKGLKLNTVCQSAHCPNWGECFSRKTATFMILGNVCTRQCSFCDVPGGIAQPVDQDEPQRLAQAVLLLKLDHVVITSVNRDDLDDGGAGHFVRVIQAVRRACPAALIEVLTPDFQGNFKSLVEIVEAQPDIFNHNLETVPRLYGRIRPQADYRQSLGIIGNVKRLNSSLYTKSGIMLGLGETLPEVWEVLKDLKDQGCDILTVGQYLRPSSRHVPVERYVHPDEFQECARKGHELGLPHVYAGPFVRSSYHASDAYQSLQSLKEF